MFLNKEEINRCGIFLFFDRDGYADEYVIRMLEDLKKSINRLLIVVNGYLDNESYARLQKCSDEIISRANIGFDVGGYREGLFYLGWKELAKYDEVVLFNYTFFGPIFPFEEMFDTMNLRDVSFWGITKHMFVESDPFGVFESGHLPEHIQSHFLVLRYYLFMSYSYKDFIYNMKNPNSYLSSIVGYEAIFTKYFQDLGYKWDVYVDVSKYEGYSYNPHMFYITELLEETRCPIIKRRSFFTDYQDFLQNTCGEASVKMYEWMKKNRPEQLELIWDNLLRLEKMEEIHMALGLNYIHESFETDYHGDKKIAIAIIIEDTDKLYFYKDYFNGLPQDIDILLYGKEQDMDKVSMFLDAHKSILRFIEEDYINSMKNLHEKNSEYRWDFVGVAHIQNLRQEVPYSNYASSEFSDWSNLFLNNNVIGNIINTFEDNNRLGMLIPPVPDYGLHFQKQYSFAPVGGSFWIRGESLRGINFNEITDHFLDDIVLKIQKNGQYTGVSYSDSYFSVAYTNENYMLRENNKAVFKRYGANQQSVILNQIKEEVANKYNQDRGYLH